MKRRTLFHCFQCPLVKDAFLTDGIYRVSIIDVPSPLSLLLAAVPLLWHPIPPSRKSLQHRESQGFNRIKIPPSSFRHRGNAELWRKGAMTMVCDVHYSFKDIPISQLTPKQNRMGSIHCVSISRKFLFLVSINTNG